jgi:hypothetical protein
MFEQLMILVYLDSRIHRERKRHKKWNSSKSVSIKQHIQVNSMEEFILRMGLISPDFKKSQ